MSDNDSALKHLSSGKDPIRQVDASEERHGPADAEHVKTAAAAAGPLIVQILALPIDDYDAVEEEGRADEARVKRMRSGGAKVDRAWSWLNDRFLASAGDFANRMTELRNGSRPPLLRGEFLLHLLAAANENVRRRVPRCIGGATAPLHFDAISVDMCRTFAGMALATTATVTEPFGFVCNLSFDPPDAAEAVAAADDAEHGYSLGVVKAARTVLMRIRRSGMLRWTRVITERHVDMDEQSPFAVEPPMVLLFTGDVNLTFLSR